MKIHETKRTQKGARQSALNNALSKIGKTSARGVSVKEIQTSVNCGCGETNAIKIELYSRESDLLSSFTMGICDVCRHD